MRNETTRKIYRPNKEKIALDYGNATNMCRNLKISYYSYQKFFSRNKKNLWFQKKNIHDAFKKMIRQGYITYIEVNIQGGNQ
ncbi:hypothetical protein BKH41_09340 [Helicobacter sp. 12S02232-10]|uniref:hypothetical protein n=1 Tax=Helicobacter sp. 12S02232-10 TaxID=1476197 RepID=UPI000BA676A9|nr:hypothetical protein [Helicobacter sp. 12S02232-10]PAF46301.1 hypothetical protein BKH41_09340 [Helicobacter sp. 12S02232-10]